MAAVDDVDELRPDVWCHEGEGTDVCLMDQDRSRFDLLYCEFCVESPDHIYVWRDAVDDLPLGKP
jgi:hypothetical protein